MFETRGFTLENEDFTVDGDLRLVDGNIKIINGDLKVKGDLIFVQTEDKKLPRLDITGGNLTASSIWGQDIYGHSIYDNYACSYFYVDGDIHITDGDLDIGNSDIAHVDNLFIENGSLYCGSIEEAFSIYVSETIHVGAVDVLFDLLCNGASIHNDSYCGRDFCAIHFCNLNDSSLYVNGKFEAAIVSGVKYLKIG